MGRGALAGVGDDETAFFEAEAALETLGDDLAEAEEQALAAEAAHSRARDAEAAARGPLNEANAKPSAWKPKPGR